MDNLTHSLFGAALAASRLGRASPLATVGIVLAANLPDVDILARPFGGHDAYLQHHRGITHAVLGVLLFFPLCVVLLGAAERRWFPDRAVDRRGRAWGLFLALASHPLLDFLNNYGWRPWLPFDARWFFGDLVFIVDPWLWLLFGGAAALAGPRSRRTHAWLATAALLACALIALSATGAGVPGGATLVLLCAGLVALTAARVAGLGAARPERTLCAFAVLTVCYLGALGWARDRALRAATLAESVPAGEVIEAWDAMPLPVDPSGWRVVLSTDRARYLQDVDAFGRASPMLRLARHEDDPLVAAARAAPCAAAWRTFARFTFAERLQGRRGAEVQLSDARFLGSPQALRFGGLDAADSSGQGWSGVRVLFDSQGRASECRR